MRLQKSNKPLVGEIVPGIHRFTRKNKILHCLADLLDKMNLIARWRGHVHSIMVLTMNKIKEKIIFGSKMRFCKSFPQFLIKIHTFHESRNFQLHFVFFF